MSEVVKGILRAVSSALQVPTIIILILLILLTIVMLGSFVAEILTERKALRLNIPKLVDDLQGKSTAEMKEIIASSTLLTRQKAAAQELISRVTYPDDTREALARQLIADEESRYGKIVKITDLTARVAPMFGLMGTLIPLGPGLIALGQGDAGTLSSSLLIAFDTTVAGLISGAISYVVSGVRKGWYEEYMIGLETIMETILDVQSTERRKALQQKKAADAARTGNTVSRDTITMTPGAVNAAYSQQAAQTAQQAYGQQQAAQPAQTAYAQQPAQPAQAAHAQRPAAPQAARPAVNPQQAAPAQAQAARPAVNPQQAAPAQAQAARPTVNPQQAVPRTTQTVRPAQPAQAARPAVNPQHPDGLQPAQGGLMAAHEEAIAKELEQIKSLDDLLENFAPKDGRQ